MTIQAGDIIPFDSVTTVNGQEIPLKKVSSHPYIHLQLRRYTGCPVCNFHLKQYSNSIEKIKENYEKFDKVYKVENIKISDANIHELFIHDIILYELYENIINYKIPELITQN